MQRTMLLPVNDLVIDLRNFRTVEQKDELEATKAMISISPDYFWGLMGSLLDDGYLPTENIIVLKDTEGKFQVKEGNRRVASLKIMLGLIDKADLDLPQKISDRIEKLPSGWIEANTQIPCAVYEISEARVVDRIVTHTHGKGQKAGRDAWEAVARARHNKIANGVPEPSLDLLEKYLKFGTNLTQEQKTRWAGRYNLTVLDEAIKKIAPRLSATSSPDLVKKYPEISYKRQLDEIIHAIGMESLTFPVIRTSPDFALRFGIPASAPSSENNNPANNPPGDVTTQNEGGADSPGNTNPKAGAQKENAPTSPQSGANSSGDASTNSSNGTSSSINKTLATATTDERSVRKALRALKPFGSNRAKVVTLRNEMLKLKLKDNPLAFCFLLRSTFEILAKAYCQDHASTLGAPAAVKSDGTDRALADVLRDIVTHLTQNNTDKQMMRLLHGPLTEIQRKDGILSITSMNQLVHNPSFTILSSDIPALFLNIHPLLEQMNK